MHATLIHNPRAGDGEHESDELLAALQAAGFTVRHLSSAAAALDTALTDPGEIVVVAGGDGTVAEVLRRMQRRDVPVGIVPLGTANNIALSFGIEGGIDTLAHGWHEAARRPLRLGRAHGPWGTFRFVEGVGFGCLAQVAAEKAEEPVPSEERHRHGRARLREVLATAEPAGLRLVLDGKPLDVPLLMVELLNIACVGPNLALAPGADPADGRLEVVAVGPADRAAMLDWLDRGTDGPPPALRLQARSVQVEWRDVPLHLDDEFPPASSGTAELEPEAEALVLLVPRQPDAA